ncbi:MAG: hypothetical protein AB8H86_22305 [Polyangiales bacterium]
MWIFINVRKCFAALSSRLAQRSAGVQVARSVSKARRSSVLLATLSLTLLACSASRQVTSDAAIDAGARVDVAFDSPSFDSPSFDVAIPDAVSIDASGAVDAGMDCRLVLVDEQVIDWPTADCGSTNYPEVVAMDGSFQLLVTEERQCRDRPSLLLSRGLRTEGGRIETGEELVIGAATGPGHIAAGDGEFAVCSGESLHVQESGGVVEATLHERLRPDCPAVECQGLVSDGAGWGVTGQYFDCGTPQAQLVRVGPRGGLREAPFTGGLGFTALSPAAYGFAALSTSGGGTSSFHAWPRSAPAPTTVSFGRVEEGPSTLAPWNPVPGAWAFVGVDRRMSISVVVFGEDGRRLLERTYEGGIGGYFSSSIRAAPTPYGLAIAVGYAWGGGRVDTATRFLAIDASGALLHDEQARDFGSETLAPIDVAANGRQVLVHRKLLVSDPQDPQTFVSLYECE